MEDRLVVGVGLEDRLLLAAVARRHEDPVETAEHVELGDGQVGEAVDPRGEAQRYEVEPAGTPRPAGRRAVLATAGAQLLAERVVELGRKRAGAHAGRVRLGDPPDLV